MKSKTRVLAIALILVISLVLSLLSITNSTAEPGTCSPYSVQQLANNPSAQGCMYFTSNGCAIGNKKVCCNSAYQPSIDGKKFNCYYSDSAPSGCRTETTPCSEPPPECTEKGRYYLDSDNDGYGDPNIATESCEAPSGYVGDNTDCKDDKSSDAEICQNADCSNPEYSKCAKCIHVGVVEVCDGIDNNCVDGVDEGVKQTIYADMDGDGFASKTHVQGCIGKEGFTTQEEDCDDSRVSVNPKAREVCNNGRDDNCNGQNDEEQCYICPESAEFKSQAKVEVDVRPKIHKETAKNKVDLYGQVDLEMKDIKYVKEDAYCGLPTSIKANFVFGGWYYDQGVKDINLFETLRGLGLEGLYRLYESMPEEYKEKTGYYVNFYETKNIPFDLGVPGTSDDHKLYEEHITIEMVISKEEEGVVLISDTIYVYGNRWDSKTKQWIKDAQLIPPISKSKGSIKITIPVKEIRSLITEFKDYLRPEKLNLDEIIGEGKKSVDMEVREKKDHYEEFQGDGKTKEFQLPVVDCLGCTIIDYNKDDFYRVTKEDIVKLQEGSGWQKQDLNIDAYVEKLEKRDGKWYVIFKQAPQGNFWIEYYARDGKLIDTFSIYPVLYNPDNINELKKLAEDSISCCQK